MRYGAYTACLTDRSLREVLETLQRLHLTSVEVNSGGFIPAPHIPLDSILASDSARDDYLGAFEEHGMELTALNCNGNPLSPNACDGPKHADDLRRSIRAAARLGVRDVITMSGLPGAEPGATYPTWVVNAWHGQDQEILAHQWPIAVRFWRELDAFARDHGVRIALELHPRNLVFNTSTFQRLIEQTGATHLGVEMDTSHLMWQQMDVPEVIRALGDRVYIAAAKDVRMCDAVRTKGVLDVDFTPVAADDPARVPVGFGQWCAAWPSDPAWRFVAVGLGHDVSYWTEVLRALRQVDPDMVINIEHEDAAMPTLDGLTLAADTLHLAAAALDDGASEA